jgi:hypothetical protein
VWYIWLVRLARARQGTRTKQGSSLVIIGPVCTSRTKVSGTSLSSSARAHLAIEAGYDLILPGLDAVAETA